MWLKAALLSLVSLVAGTANANPVQSEHIAAGLIAEVTSAQPGHDFWVGLHLKPEPGWKTYWRNPGSSGLATAIQWQLPEGVSASPIHWSYPERFTVQDIASYGYTSEVLLLTRIQTGTALQPGARLPINAVASWLVCSDSCIPGTAELTLNLPVSDKPPTTDSRWAAAFAAARNRLPIDANHWSVGVGLENKLFHLEVEASEPIFADAKAVEFFPGQQYLVADAAPQETEWQGARLSLKQKADELLTTLPEAIDGVLVVQTNSDTRAYAISATSLRGADLRTGSTGKGVTAVEDAPPHLIAVLAMAIAGGLLLNLMPCVFPVLSLKAIALMEAFNISDHSHHLHGIAYTLGVISFFCVVAGVLYLLRASGAAVGWGFQLQTPWFVAVLAYLLFVLGLSFSGLLEFGARFMSVGESLARRGGYTGSFFTGALAAVVASPCTAPFMGTAIAFAVVQPPLYSLLVFIALGLGMALPFLMIGYMPELGSLLPRPGPWMNIFKQLMAFPLYLTAIWLLWVLGRQTSATGMALVLIGMMLILLAVWLQHVKPRPKGGWRKVNLTLTVLSVIAALGILVTPALRTASTADAAWDTGESVFWQPFSAKRLAELRAQGRAVFINMTADWCLTCIVNERVALSSPEVRQEMKEHDIVPLKGDWTNSDPEITAVLEQFGHSGVPLYVLYPPGRHSEPLLLPQWLRPDTVRNAIREMAGYRGEPDET